MSAKLAYLLCCLGIVMAACSMCNQRLGVKDDHAVEELAEKLIESQTGLDIDLTPFSPE